ncbi:hypothetical protein LTS18_012586, partial [Coniosporium uncinatum]
GIVAASLLGAQLVASPPYLWGEKAGLVNIGGIVGAFLGLGWTALTADWYTKRQAKKESHGFAEAEDRLYIALPGLFFSVTGMLTFGFVAQNPSPNGWLGLEFGLGMIAFGLMQA